MPSPSASLRHSRPRRGRWERGPHGVSPVRAAAMRYAGTARRVGGRETAPRSAQPGVMGLAGQARINARRGGTAEDGRRNTPTPPARTPADFTRPPHPGLREPPRATVANPVRAGDEHSAPATFPRTSGVVFAVRWRLDGERARAWLAAVVGGKPIIRRPNTPRPARDRGRPYSTRRPRSGPWPAGERVEGKISRTRPSAS